MEKNYTIVRVSNIYTEELYTEAEIKHFKLHSLADNVPDITVDELGALQKRLSEGKAVVCQDYAYCPFTNIFKVSMN